MFDALSYFKNSVGSSAKIIGRPETIYVSCMRLYCACCWLGYKMCFMQVEVLGNVQFTGETLPKFWQKVSCPKSSLVKEDIVLRSKPGVGVMPGSPQGSSRVPGNSGRVLSPMDKTMQYTNHSISERTSYEPESSNFTDQSIFD